MKRLLVLALAACSSQQTTAPQQTSPAPAPAPAGSRGRVLTEEFESAALGVEKTYRVYLPSGYDSESPKRWPVYYFLNPLGGNELNWTDVAELGGIADEFGLQAIVVMPDGDDGFYIDSPTPVDFEACMKDGSGLFLPGVQNRQHTCVKQRNYETYIVKDLIGEIDAKYKTIASREGRGVAGFSMGGFGALQLSMRHPDLFAAGVSHAGVDALLYAGPRPYAKGQVKLFTQDDLTNARKGNSEIDQIGAWMRELFGRDLAVWKSYDPATLAEKVEPGKPALYIDCGTEDVFALNNGAQYLHDILTERKIDHAFYLGPGGHDFKFVKTRLPESLKFLRDHTAKPQ